MHHRRTKKPLPAAPRARGRGLLFACFALGMVFAQLLGVGHLVFVSHALCEHGALQHADAVTRPRDVAAEADARRVSSALPGRDAGEHEHCDPFAVAPAALTVDPSFAAPALLEAPPPAWRGGSPVAFEAIALLSLAPKSSPPAGRFPAS